MFPGPDSTGFVSAEWDERFCSSAIFCYVGVLGDLSDCVVPSVRCATADVVIVFAF